jgi:hypothetical protein
MKIKFKNGSVVKKGPLHKKFKKKKQGTEQENKVFIFPHCVPLKKTVAAALIQNTHSFNCQFFGHPHANNNSEDDDERKKIIYQVDN